MKHDQYVCISNKQLITKDVIYQSDLDLGSLINTISDNSKLHSLNIYLKMKWICMEKINLLTISFFDCNYITESFLLKFSYKKCQKDISGIKY